MIREEKRGVVCSGSSDARERTALRLQTSESLCAFTRTEDVRETDLHDGDLHPSLPEPDRRK
ncbi:hypothetical protein JOB18_010512 [Solea senegalensis]|uniref:Uncharacterized protein n=1 Tax=Solea senegalensis TaxID=28829 RepID=A0AAV6PRM5_SOLSE|nr:hypothetical protein JOB18_010512 [Solea senegalensis]